jgi:hypothetical protein
VAVSLGAPPVVAKLTAAALSVGLGFSPVGQVLDVVSAVTGVDPISGDKLSWPERILAVTPVDEVVAGAKLLGGFMTAIKAADWIRPVVGIGIRDGDEVAGSVDEAIEAGEEIARNADEAGGVGATLPEGQASGAPDEPGALPREGSEPGSDGQPALVPTALAQRVQDAARREAVARRAREAAAEKLKGLDTCAPGTPNCLPLAIRADKALGDEPLDIPNYSSTGELAAGENVTNLRRWMEERYGSAVKDVGSARELAGTLTKLPPGTRALIFLSDSNLDVHGHTFNAVVLETGELLIVDAQRGVKFRTVKDLDQMLTGAFWNKLAYIVTHTP